MNLNNKGLEINHFTVKYKVEHIRKLAENEQVECISCVTAQHREMLVQVFALFDIKQDVDLNLMRPNQTLAKLTSMVFEYPVWACGNRKHSIGMHRYTKIIQSVNLILKNADESDRMAKQLNGLLMLS